MAPGEIVSLLGPNGAGKTTLVSIVAGLRKADAGVVEVAGLRRAAPVPPQVRQKIGLAPQDIGVYPVVSVRRNLALFGELAGVRGPELQSRIDEVAEALDITDLLDRQAGKLSGGQKRRLHTAIALLHRPRPAAARRGDDGADVETRGHILELVRQLAADGSAVLYSTHYLAEVENLGATAAIIDAGKVIARDGVAALIARHASPVVEITFSGEVPAVREGASRRRQPAAVSDAGPRGDDRDVVPQIPSGSARSSIEIVRPSLESVYLALTGRRYEEADRVGRQRSR